MDQLRKTIIAVIVIALLWLSSFAQSGGPLFVLDMVHHNPGEPLTRSAFNDPGYLQQLGYNGQVINDFTFAHAALTFDRLNPQLFPQGSAERNWILAAAEKVKQNIRNAHASGLKVYYFTDIIVLPKKLVELYRDQICDENGKISFERPMTIQIHRLMFDELFERFPDLDGLVIRTGETYLNNVPYHTGNNPITNGDASHVKLISLLREEVCVKRNRQVFYRTWLSGGMHEKQDVYLRVTNQAEPHPNLVFSIKHTKGDYHRTFDFNPTLGIGKHRQIVEVQCQREYEGKGAFPNYIGAGVIDGFEEFGLNKPQQGSKSLNDIKGLPQFGGTWTWSRGGGWVGPYISNEFWCRLNAWIISAWTRDPEKPETELFNDFMDRNGIRGASRQAFRELCLLSAKAVLRGHNSAELQWDIGWVWWTRDQFLSGTDGGRLVTVFKTLYDRSELNKAVAEKYEAVKMWERIVHLSNQVVLADKSDQEYIRVSSRYGLLLHRIIASGWEIMALGYTGEQTGNYDKAGLAAAIRNYDAYWKAYSDLKKDNPSCATLYEPYAFVNKAPEYHAAGGMGASVDKYRKIAFP